MTGPAAQVFTFAKTFSTGALSYAVVGLDQLNQFNVAVPDVAAGSAPLAVTVDGVALEQSLFVAVR